MLVTVPAVPTNITPQRCHTRKEYASTIEKGPAKVTQNSDHLSHMSKYATTVERGVLGDP